MTDQITVKLRAGGVRHRVLGAMNFDAPTSMKELAPRLPDLSRNHVGAEVSYLIARGALLRMSRGRYRMNPDALVMVQPRKAA